MRKITEGKKILSSMTTMPESNASREVMLKAPLASSFWPVPTSREQVIEHPVERKPARIMYILVYGFKREIPE